MRRYLTGLVHMHDCYDERAQETASVIDVPRKRVTLRVIWA